jgi:hypothetical protein
MDPQATLKAAGVLKEPTLKNLMNLVRVTDPCRLGLELNVDSHDIRLVQQNHPNNHQKPLLDVFTLYLQQTEEPSWLQVVAALRTMGEARLARTIMEKFHIYEVNEVTPTDCSGGESPAPSDSAGGSLLTRRPIHNQRHSGPANGQKTTTDTTPQPWWCCLKVLLVCNVLAGAIVVTVMFVSYEESHPIHPPRDPVTKSSSTNTKPVNPTFTPGEYEDWLTKEPTLKFLSLIMYTDSKGKKKSFRLISEVQNNCQKLGTELGIDPPILKGLQNSHGTPSDICKEILQTWRERGVQVILERLLQGLHDIQLGRIEKGLREALSQSSEINNAE